MSYDTATGQFIRYRADTELSRSNTMINKQCRK